MVSIGYGWLIRATLRLAAGVPILYADNFAFEGEVSPVVIVAMLLGATATAGAI
ncbi:MAG: hypothetical protein KJ645_14245 [Planctomycetes bacterium]|nr:hypothetical protein [Planctomycetota bacterium]